MSSTNRFSLEKDTASTTYKSARTSIYSPRTKRLLKKIKRSSFANPAWKSTLEYERNPKNGRTFIINRYSNLWKPRGRDFQRREICNVFPCIFNHWSSPPNRFPFFRNLSYPYLSITRYPNNPDSAESDPITHLIITHTYSYYPPVRPFGVPFPLIQFPANYRVIWRHLQITSVPPLVFNPAATTSSRSVAASSSP